MVTVNGLILDTTYEQIIEDLKADCIQNENYLFPKIKPMSSSIQFSCPFHGNGQEKHPSCGLIKNDIVRSNRTIPAGTVHCFTGGYMEELTTFISNVFGFMDGGRYGNQWLKSLYTASLVVTRPNIQINIQRGYMRPVEAHRRYISETVLDSYRYTHPYMYQRGLTDELIEQYDIGFDSNTNCITMPLRDLSGGTVFVNRRSVGTKFHNFGKDDPKTDYVYGMYEMQQCNVEENEPIYVTESILNALTWRKFGFWAVAFMGVGGGNQYEILKNSKYRHFITSFDPDDAGDRATQRFISNLRKYKTIEQIQYPDYCYKEKLDINDLQEAALDLPITLIR